MLMSVNRVLKNGVLMNGFKITRGKIGCGVCVYIKTNLQLCNGSCEMVIVELASSIITISQDPIFGSS